jgi:acetyl esterase/lipase
MRYQTPIFLRPRRHQAMLSSAILGLLLLAGLGLPACAQQTTPARPSSPNPETAERIRDVIYAKKEGVALTMDVFKPAKPNGAGILWMVSGGWVSNHNGINPELARLFNRRGYTVFQVVHGSQPRYALRDITSDIYRAVRFVRANAAKYGVDPERLGISGASAGGHLSLMVGSYDGPTLKDAPDPVDREPVRVKAVACFFPPTDMLNWGKEGVTVQEVANLRPFWAPMQLTDQTPKEKVEEMGRAYSPYYHATKAMPPTLIIHGDADELVPIQQAERFDKRLEELGVPHKLERRPGKGHGWPELPKDVEVLADWFDKYLAATPK